MGTIEQETWQAIEEMITQTTYVSAYLATQIAIEQAIYWATAQATEWATYQATEDGM